MINSVRRSKKLVCGVGINDSEYPTSLFGVEEGSRKLLWRCPYYTTWHNMISRVYSGHKNCSAYHDVVVCEEWLLFSNFKSWMETQDWEGKELDKDIFGDGKLYSPTHTVVL